MSGRPVVALMTAVALLGAACGSGESAEETSVVETDAGSSSTIPAPGDSTATSVDDAAPTTSSSEATTTEPPSDSSGTTGGPAGHAEGDFVCTEVIGFSQAGSTRNGGWFTVGGFEELDGIDDGAWQIRWRSSAEAELWIDPSYDGWRDGRLSSPCETPTVDRVVMFFLHRSREIDDYVATMGEVATSLAERFPDLRQIVFEPLVGGPGEELCTVPSRGGTVFSTEAHRRVDEAVAIAADGFIAAGASPEVPSCDQFVDKPGHLTPEGAEAVAEWMAAFYGN